MTKSKMFVIALGAAIGALLALATPAQCAWCSTLPCLSSATCGGKCVCVKRGLDLDGFCASVNVQGEP